MINGIINVRKEAGFTSHDVVAKLRGILKQKKIGHTGTLDPDATGVLPVCLGKATKLCDTIGGWTKCYRTVMLLGRSTDTEDISGRILSESPVSLSEEEIRSLILSFEGPYQQVPPMYSAKKVKGKRLYELAREGITIERKACPVHIHAIQILTVDLPRVTFEVTCSKGTYIRSLCRDIGEKAGCGACMESLVRTAVSDFSLEDSLSLSDIEGLRDQGKLFSAIRPIDDLFRDKPALCVKEEWNKLLYNGNPLPLEAIPSAVQAKIRSQSTDSHGSIRVYDQEGAFIGLYRMDFSRNRLEPVQLYFLSSNNAIGIE